MGNIKTNKSSLWITEIHWPSPCLNAEVASASKLSRQSSDLDRAVNSRCKKALQGDWYNVLKTTYGTQLKVTISSILYGIRSVYCNSFRLLE